MTTPHRDRSLLVAVAAVAATAGGGAAFAVDSLRNTRHTPHDPQLAALASQRESLPVATPVATPNLPTLKRPRRPRIVHAQASTMVVARPAAVRARPTSSPSPAAGDDAEGGSDD